MKKSTAVASVKTGVIDLMTEKEVAAKLRVSVPTMRYIRENGMRHHDRKIPYHMIGTKDRQGIVYFASEVNQWLSELRTYTGAAHQESKPEKPAHPDNYVVA